MNKDEIKDIAISWASNEGWNPGLYDLDSYYSIDPNGFFIGLIKDEPIACISAVAYDSEFGFLGFYIVKPEYRHKGYGFKLWNRALEHLPTQNIGLDGVVDQQENYKRSGFKAAWRNIRYKGVSKKLPSNVNIVPLIEVDFKELMEFDSKVFPASRERFLRYWMIQPESHAVGLWIKGKLKGYGVIRKCVEGYKIGPLFAMNKKYALDIFASLNNFLKPNTLFFIDIPERNRSAIELAENNGMTSMFETARMYSIKEPKIELNRVYGLTGLEVG